VFEGSVGSGKLIHNNVPVATIIIDKVKILADDDRAMKFSFEAV
jgi:hypothetical protein